MWILATETGTCIDQRKLSSESDFALRAEEIRAFVSLAVDLTEMLAHVCFSGCGVSDSRANLAEILFGLKGDAGPTGLPVKSAFEAAASVRLMTRQLCVFGECDSRLKGQ